MSTISASAEATIALISVNRTKHASVVSEQRFLDRVPAQLGMLFPWLNLNGGQMLNMSRRGHWCAATAIVLCGVLLITGCTQTTTIQAGANQQQGPYITITHTIIWDPPGSYLASFDATQALLNLSLTNATISSTSGTVNVSVKDLTTGQIVGQQSFGYVVNGNSIYAQDPTAVYNWLQQFTGYANIDVIVGVDTTLLTTAPGSASSVGSATYQGTSYASASVGWNYIDNGGVGTCHTRICPNQ